MHFSAAQTRGVINEVSIINSSLAYIVELEFLSHYFLRGATYREETYDNRLERCYYTYQRIVYGVEPSLIHFIKLLSKSGYDGSKKLSAVFQLHFSLSFKSLIVAGFSVFVSQPNSFLSNQVSKES